MKLDWSKPLEQVTTHGIKQKAKFIAFDGNNVIVRLGENLNYFCYNKEGYTVFGYNHHQYIRNIVEETTVWVWKVRINVGLPGEDTQVGWSWSEKEARAYAGNALLSLKKVTLTEGEGCAGS